MLTQYRSLVCHDQYIQALMYHADIMSQDYLSIICCINVCQIVRYRYKS